MTKTFRDFKVTYIFYSFKLQTISPRKKNLVSLRIKKNKFFEEVQISRKSPT